MAVYVHASTLCRFRGPNFPLFFPEGAKSVILRGNFGKQTRADQYRPINVETHFVRVRKKGARKQVYEADDTLTSVNMVHPSNPSPAKERFADVSHLRHQQITNLSVQWAAKSVSVVELQTDIIIIPKTGCNLAGKIPSLQRGSCDLVIFDLRTICSV